MVRETVTTQSTEKVYRYVEALSEYAERYGEAENDYDKLLLKLWLYTVAQEGAYTNDRNVITFEEYLKTSLLDKILLVKSKAVDVSDLKNQDKAYLIKLLTSHSGRLS